MDEDVLRDLLTADPTNVGAAEALAKILSQQARWDELAQHLLERVERGEQPLAQLYRRLAEVMDVRLGAPESALVVLLEALALLKDDALLGEPLAELAGRLDQWTAVLEAYEQGTQTASAPLVFHRRLATWYAQLGDLAAEVHHRKHVFEYDPSDMACADSLTAYYETNEDWSSLADLLKTKLGYTQGAQNKALTVRAASILSEYLHQHDDAFDLLGRVYRSGPTPDMRESLERYAYLGGLWSKLASLYQVTLASGSHSNEFEKETHSRLAELFIGELSDGVQAVQHYAQAVKLAPVDEKLNGGYRDLLRSMGDVSTLATRITFDLEHITEPDVRFTLLVELGDLQAHTSDMNAAIEAWLKALAIQRDDKALLVKLMDGFHVTEQWANSIKTIKKLTAIENEPSRRAKYYYTVGVIQRDKIDDFTAAVRSFDQALEFEPTFVRAFHAIEELLQASGDHVRKDRYYRKMLVRCIDHSLEPELVLLVARLLGDLNRRELNNYPAALEAYEVALKYGGGDRSLYKIVAELEARTGAYDAAEKTLFSLIENEPSDLECFHALVNLYSTTGQLDRVFCTCRILVLMGHATPDEITLYESVQQNRNQRQVRPMDSSGWQAVEDYIEHSEISALLALLTPILLDYVSRSERAVGVSVKLTDGLEHAQRLVALVAAILGRPTPEIRMSRRVDGVDVGHLSQPILLGSPKLATLDRAEQIFSATRSFILLQPTYYLATLDRDSTRATARLKQVLSTVHKWIEPDSHQPQSMPDLLELLQLQSAEEQSRYTAHLNGVKHLRDYGIPEWLDSVERMITRLGFAICDNLEVVIQILRRDPSTLGSQSMNDRILDLLKYAVSPEYYQLRARLALTITAPEES